MIPQHSTNLAQTRLTSEIGRDRVLSGWYDRAMRIVVKLVVYIPSILAITGKRTQSNRDLPLSGLLSGLDAIGFRLRRVWATLKWLPEVPKVFPGIEVNYNYRWAG